MRKQSCISIFYQLKQICVRYICELHSICDIAAVELRGMLNTSHAATLRLLNSISYINKRALYLFKFNLCNINCQYLRRQRTCFNMFRLHFICLKTAIESH